MSKITHKERSGQSMILFATKYGVTRAVFRYEVNRQYIYRWMKRYDGTIESLQDRSSRPHSHPNEHTRQEIELIQNIAINGYSRFCYVEAFDENGTYTAAVFKVERSHRKDNEYFYATHKFYSLSDFAKQLADWPQIQQLPDEASKLEVSSGSHHSSS